MRRKKGVVGREDNARLSVPFVDSDRIITVVYHRIVVRCSNSATGVEIVKKEISAWVLLWYEFLDKID